MRSKTQFVLNLLHLICFIFSTFFLLIFIWFSIFRLIFNHMKFLKMMPHTKHGGFVVIGSYHFSILFVVVVVCNYYSMFVVINVDLSMDTSCQQYVIQTVHSCSQLDWGIFPVWLNRSESLSVFFASFVYRSSKMYLVPFDRVSRNAIWDRVHV